LESRYDEAALATAPYAAAEPGELTLREGDVITILEKVQLTSLTLAPSPPSRRYFRAEAAPFSASWRRSRCAATPQWRHTVTPRLRAGSAAPSRSAAAAAHAALTARRTLTPHAATSSPCTVTPSPCTL
jgi:hypothetical protein